MWSRVAQYKRLFSERWPRVRGHLGLVVRVGVLVWLVGHFSHLTALYVMPDNPLSESLQPLLRATIGRYFEQNWRCSRQPPPVQPGATRAPAHAGPGGGAAADRLAERGLVPTSPRRCGSASSTTASHPTSD